MSDNQTEEAARLESWRQFTNKKFLEWQNQMGARKTITAFANYIGIPQPTVSLWLNGSRLPKSNEEIEKISSIWGLDVYDALQVERPDEYLYKLKKVWKDLSTEKRRAISEEAAEYAKKKKKK